MTNVKQVMEQSIKKILNSNIVKITNDQISDNERQDALKNICVFNSIQDVQAVDLTKMWNKR